MARKKRFKVLITGGGGFVGQTLVPCAWSRGFSVRVTDLPSREFSHVARGDVEILKGDLLDRDFCMEISKRVDYIIHNAAAFDLSMDKETLLEINVKTTRNLTESAIRNRVRHLLYISTADVYGTHRRVPIGEDFEKRPDNDYAMSKLLSEEECLRMGRKGGLPVTVLRPTAIYGPNSSYIASVFYTLPFIIYDLLGHVPRITGGPLLNLVNVEDVAGASLHLLGRDGTEFEAFNVNDDTWMSFGDFVKTMSRAFGLKISKLPLYFEKHIISYLGRLGYRRLKKGDLDNFNRLLQKRWRRMQLRYNFKPCLKPSFHRGFFSYSFGDHIYDNRKLKDAGYRLLHPDFFHSFEKTARWYIEKGWLPDLRGG